MRRLSPGAGRVIDRLGAYAEVRIDEMILNFSIGASQNETLEAMRRFAEEVMPYFTGRPAPRGMAPQLSKQKEIHHAHDPG